MRGSSVERGGKEAAIEAAFAEALRQFGAGKLSLADRACRRLLGLAPRHAEGLNLQGIVRLRLGQLDAAADSLRAAIAAAPDSAQYHSNLGAVLQRARRPAEAAEAFARALALTPDLPELHVNLAAALKELGRLEEAVACYDRALALRPHYPEAQTNLASALEGLGRIEAAAARYRQALALRPDLAEAHCGLGRVLGRQSLFAAAEQSYRRAIALRPDLPEALTRLAGTLLQLRRPAEAEAACRKALALRPDHAETETFLGIALRELGRQEEALTWLRRAMAREPDVADTRLDLAVAGLPILPATAAESRAAPAEFAAAVDGLAAWAEGHLAALGEVVGRLQPFELAYRPGNLRAPLSRYGDLMARAAAAYHQPAPPRARDAAARGGRIRLAVCTGHIRRHPVWDVILKGLVEGLDRARFELLLYHTRPETDAETAWARGRADGFVQGPMRAAAWLARIAEDAPDILLYPEIGMDPMALTLAALRLAPLQVAAWGHPVTTGLPTVDLFLSGALLEAPGAEAHYREALVRLPGTGVRMRMPAVAVAPPDAAALDLPADRGVARLVLPHMPFKLDPLHDGLIAAAARAAAPCRLWLPLPPEYPWAAERVRARLGAALGEVGLDPAETLRLLPWLPQGGFLGLLDAMDVYLDAPAFSGYTTAWQAVHRGLPIVTLEGEFLRQRLAAGLLRQIGQAETVAATGAEYVAIAGRLAAEAREPARREARRAAIRAAAAARADGDDGVLRALEDVLAAALPGAIAAWRQGA